MEKKRATKKFTTEVIHKKVHHFFWLNLVPLGILCLFGYWFYTGELSLRQMPKGTEKLLWVAVLSALLGFTLLFLTYPFAVWLRRSAKRGIQKTVPWITGEEGFLPLLMGIPLWLLRVIWLICTWCLYLLVLVLIVFSFFAFFCCLGYALYLTLWIKGAKP